MRNEGRRLSEHWSASRTVPERVAKTVKLYREACASFVSRRLCRIMFSTVLRLAAVIAILSACPAAQAQEGQSPSAPVQAASSSPNAAPPPASQAAVASPAAAASPAVAE